MADLSRGTVEAAGHRWTYAYREADAADAPVIVMLHGFTGSKENWYPLANELGGRYRLLIPDLPGWGESERRAGAVYGFPQQAANVEAFIRALSPGTQAFPGAGAGPVIHEEGGRFLQVP